MKKAKELSKENEGNEHKKPSMRLESNVGMVNGYKKTHDYAQHLNFNAGFKKLFFRYKKCKRCEMV